MEKDASAQTLTRQNQQKLKAAFGGRLKEALLPNAAFWLMANLVVTSQAKP
jgi:hypothetical protein